MKWMFIRDTQSDTVVQLGKEDSPKLPEFPGEPLRLLKPGCLSLDLWNQNLKERIVGSNFPGRSGSSGPTLGSGRRKTIKDV